MTTAARTFIIESVLAFLMFAIVVVPPMAFTGVYEDGSFRLLGTSYCIPTHGCDDALTYSDLDHELKD